MATKVRKRPPTPAPRAKPGAAKAARSVKNPLLLGLDPLKPIETHNTIRGGLTYKSLSDFVKASQLSLRSVAELIDLPLSTLDRRKKSNKPLKPDESDRLYRLAQVVEKAVGLFEGDVTAARQWLTAPVRGLGHQVPIELARTAVGAQMVLDLIGRLEHGVFT
jgi:putative toxin-antitoxin system antitoxin component (TIGR02293 family)